VQSLERAGWMRAEVNKIVGDFDEYRKQRITARLVAVFPVAIAREPRFPAEKSGSPLIISGKNSENSEEGRRVNRSRSSAWTEEAQACTPAHPQLPHALG
jgi:hypothetical protein